MDPAVYYIIRVSAHDYVRLQKALERDEKHRTLCREKYRKANPEAKRHSKHTGPINLQLINVETYVPQQHVQRPIIEFIPTQQTFYQPLNDGGLQVVGTL